MLPQTLQTFSCPACGAHGAPGSVCPNDGTKLPVAALKRGFKAGDYVGLYRIGLGGMGEVWKGEQPAIKKQVAIKVLGEKFLGDKELVSRFRQEALAVNTIRNKHIVDIFALGELPDGRPFMVMEYLSGLTLRQHLERGPLPYADITDIFGQLCRGLSAAHEKGIVHRDLKPDNVFLVLEEGERPFVKLLDFGIAKLQEGLDLERGHRTRDGAAFGTPAYISPEQCVGASGVDHRADIYSLGVILYEMIAGRTPFYEEGEHHFKVIMRHITATPPLVSEAVSGREVPKALDELLRQVLSKKPAERPQSCDALYRQLSAALGEAKEGEAAPRPRPLWSGQRPSGKPQADPNQETLIGQEVGPSAAPEAPPSGEATAAWVGERPATSPSGSSPALLFWALGAALLLAIGAAALFSSTGAPRALAAKAPSPASEPAPALKIQAPSPAPASEPASLPKEPASAPRVKEPSPSAVGTPLPSPSVKAAPTKRAAPPAKREEAPPKREVDDDSTADPFARDK